MGITAFPFTAVIDVPTARILGRDDAGTGSAEALTNTEIFAILGTGTPSASTYLRGDGTWSTVSAGVGGSTGSVDNAVLRADGTGGATLQSSAIVIPDNYTSSPNATVNHASIQATGATTNVSVSIVPKGTGSFSLQVPDGAATGGNVRGANAVDLQTSRNNAANVASGSTSFLGNGVNNQATGTQSFVGNGSANTATATRATVVNGNSNSVSDEGAFIGAGQFNSCTSFYAVVCGGSGNQSSAPYASILGGLSARANRYAMRAFSAGNFASDGDSQGAEMVLRGSTTTDAAVRLRPDNSTQRLTIASGQICQYLLIITGVRNGGADVASYMRQVTIKNIGGTTSLVGTVNTIGVDNAAGTSLSVTADDTNDDLAVEPTGVSGQTWRWECVVYGGEIRHGA